MSLEDENRDRDDDLGWIDEEVWAIKREEQFRDLIDQQKHRRRILIGKVDETNSWYLVAKLLDAREYENGQTSIRDQEVNQDFYESLVFRLRLPGDLKGYLLYQFLLVRDFGVCACIVACLYAITGLVIKFVPYLTHS